MSIIATPSLSITPVTPPVGGEPTYDSGIHTSIYFEDFESYADTAALKAAYDFAESHGSIVLDTASGVVNGTKCYRVDWNNDGCGSDYDVKISKSLSDPGTRELFYVSFYVKTTLGYEGTTSGEYGVGCSSGTKSVILNQNHNNAGRIVFDMWKWSPEIPPVYCTNGDCGDTMSWCAADTWGVTCEGSNCNGGDTRMVGHLNLSTHNSQTDIARGYGGLLNDGNWHRVTMGYRRETSNEAGDGLWQVWLDGTAVANYDGENPTNGAYQRTYTGNYSFVAQEIAYPATVNGGFNTDAIPNLQIWHDGMRVFYVT